MLRSRDAGGPDARAARAIGVVTEANDCSGEVKSILMLRKLPQSQPRRAAVRIGDPARDRRPIVPSGNPVTTP